MKTSDVLGYYRPDGDAVCVDCAPDGAENDDDFAPIFADSEADAPTHCVVCESLILHDLTAEGRAYVKDAVSLGRGRPEILRMWREEYL